MQGRAFRPERRDAFQRAFDVLWTAHTATIARGVLSLIALAALLQSCVFVHRNFMPYAWFDYWWWVADFQRWVEHTYSFHDLIKPHLEHRIATTRLFLLLDSVFFRMRGRFVVIANMLIIVALGFLFWNLARLPGSNPRQRGFPALFWAALLSAVAQFQNLIMPFQIQFALTCIFAVGAAGLLARASELSGRRAAIAAIWAGLFSILAAFSMASGVLATPALLGLLALRRARPALWATYAPLSLAGVGLFFLHYSHPQYPALPLLDGHLAWKRILYAGNFLGSALNAFPEVAAGFGLAAALLFLGVSTLVWLRARSAGGSVDARDAALIAIGIFVLLCAAAGTVTSRIVFGPQAALVSRYATMSLLFIAVIFALLLRRIRPAGRWAQVDYLALCAGGVAVLWVADAPRYDRFAGSIHDMITASARLVANNVGIAGPSSLLLGGNVDDVRDPIVFLHAHRLNMFAPDEGVRGDYLRQIQQAGSDRLPPCQGHVDRSYAVDDTAFRADGWLADSDGRRGAPWIAAADDQGDLLGVFQALVSRLDSGGSSGAPKTVKSFAGAFRIGLSGDPDDGRRVWLIGLFPDHPGSTCRFPRGLAVGPVVIEPLGVLRDPAVATATKDWGGLGAWQGGDGMVARQPSEGIAAWGFVAGRYGSGAAPVHMHVIVQVADGRALAIPFATTEDIPARRVVFTLADGKRLEAPLPSSWGPLDWRAAVLPADVLARHPGPVDVEIDIGGGSWMAVGQPLWVTTRPEWSRLF